MLWLRWAKTEYPKLIIRVINFELVQPICSRYHNVTDGRTDGWTTYDSNTPLALHASRGENCKMRHQNACIVSQFWVQIDYCLSNAMYSIVHCTMYSRQNGRLVGWLVGGKSCLSVRAKFAHISGTGHPIDFLFDPTVGFSGTADRMDVLPVSPNLRWRLFMTSSRNNRCRNFGAKYLGNEAR